MEDAFQESSDDSGASSHPNPAYPQPIESSDDLRERGSGVASHPAMMMLVMPWCRTISAKASCSVGSKHKAEHFGIATP